MRTRRNRRSVADTAAVATALTTAGALSAAALTLLLLSSTSGCGGGDGGDGTDGGSPTPTPTPTASASAAPFSTQYRVRIAWGARTRQALPANTINGRNLSSAIYARVGISRSTSINAPDFVAPDFVARRDANRTEQHEIEYTSPAPVEFNRPGQPLYLIVTFHAQEEVNGERAPIVGYCILPANVNPANGQVLGSVNVTGVISRVEVLPNQVVNVETPAELAVTCFTSGGTPIAISAGSVFPTVTSGDGLEVRDDGLLVGRRPATVNTVTARVDNITSQTATVRVTSSTAVAINPLQSDLSLEESRQLTATVSGAPEGQRGVTWSVEGGDQNGTVTPEGLYKAPKREGTFTVIATSDYDPEKSARATVTVASGVTVSVAPTNADLNWEGTQQFAATISRVPEGQNGVTWTVEKASDADNGPLGSINDQGVYTAPRRDATVKVVATSRYDTRRRGEVLVKVESRVAVAVAPQTAQLSLEETVDLGATVTNAPENARGVTWSVEGGDENGTVSTDGVYRAPKREGTFTVVATSNYDPRKTARATITVVSAVKVNVTPSPASVPVRRTLQLAATVERTPDQGVDWSVEPSPDGRPTGTISATGLYTAPDYKRTDFVLARSKYDPTKVTRVPVEVLGGSATVEVR